MPGLYYEVHSMVLIRNSSQRSCYDYTFLLHSSSVAGHTEPDQVNSVVSDIAVLNCSYV